jgi:hypothetical protein
MSANSLLPWVTGGKRAPEDLRDIVMIAGEDPYAWRGIQDVNVPYVRPDNPQRAAQVYGRLAELARERRQLQGAGG